MIVAVPYRQSMSICMIAFFAVLTGCVGIGGTTVELRTNNLAPPSHPAHGQVSLLQEAGDAYPGTPAVGKAVWTAFKAELAPITASPPAKIQVVTLAKQALEKAGYEVRLVPVHESSSAGGPVIHLKIEEFSYEMWSYWFPYIPIEGRTIIVATVQGPDGRQIDSRVFSAAGKETCWFAGCRGSLEVAMAQSLTNIMNQFIDWASGTTFRTAIARTASFPGNAP